MTELRKNFLTDSLGVVINPATSEDINPSQVPSTFSKGIENSTMFPMVPGVSTKFKMRPEVLNEHVESSREILATVTTLKSAGQIFKASQDNINSISLSMESATAENIIDDIEYAGNNANLQATWVLTGTNLAITEAVIISPNKGSTESMKLPMDIVADEWRTTIPVTDLTGTTIEFDYFQDKESIKTTMTLSLTDDVNVNVTTLAVPKSLKGIWSHFSIPTSAFIGIANLAIITNIFFTVTLPGKVGENAYTDNFRIRPAPGSVQLELWDMGATLPANNGTINYTTGTQYTELGDRGIQSIVATNVILSLEGGFQTYHIQQFTAGVALEIPTNTLLTVNNYYAIVIKYVDTDVSVYGADTTFSRSHYTNGYAWTAETADNLIDLSLGISGAGAYSDLAFMIYSTADTYVEKIILDLFDSNGISSDSAIRTRALFHIEDKNMDNIIIANKHFLRANQIEDLGARPYFTEKGSKVEVYYSANVNDPISSSVMSIKYLYIDPIING